MGSPTPGVTVVTRCHLSMPPEAWDLSEGPLLRNDGSVAYSV